ncbi:uncharacterized protein LOC143020338 isoform X2 [Oratosquilla oratoria]|uniref:uncharacterized protein LOC143020338 isoform X2 n=1 Tax=Oratosquilla oratoria TaxID=337810 RepID=UPI003F77369C
MHMQISNIQMNLLYPGDDVKSHAMSPKDVAVSQSPEEKNNTRKVVIDFEKREEETNCRNFEPKDNQTSPLVLPEKSIASREVSEDIRVDVIDGDDDDTDGDDIDLHHWCCDPEIWIALFGFICFTWSLLQASFFVFVMKNAWQFDEDKIVAASSGGCLAVALLYSLSTFAITFHTFQNLDLCLCCCPSLFLTASLWEGRAWRSFWWTYSILSLLVSLINIGLCVWWGFVIRDDIPMLVSAISAAFYVVFWVVLLRTLGVEKSHRIVLADLEMMPAPQSQDQDQDQDQSQDIRRRRLGRLPSTSILRPPDMPVTVA